MDRSIIDFRHGRDDFRYEIPQPTQHYTIMSKILFPRRGRFAEKEAKELLANLAMKYSIRAPSYASSPDIMVLIIVQRFRK